MQLNGISIVMSRHVRDSFNYCYIYTKRNVIGLDDKKKKTK